MSTHEEPSSAEVNWSDSRCCIISVPYHLIGKSVAERYAPIWGYSNRFCVAASTTRARHKSEAICPNARQSQESWRTPYCQTEPRRGALGTGERCLTNSVAGLPSLTVVARIGGSRPSTFMSRTG